MNVNILNKLEYPTNFEKILETVKHSGGTQNDIYFVQRLPKKFFIKQSDLAQEMNKITAKM